ncbi:MBL fold metallo-hydrolase [Rhizobium sp. AAP43]|uniref:MBL fold metallo-hydrolase n=1 Tax=Rhizobium sp. AAP43 TaxID=1523420 RepID=UPI0009EABC4B|nr:MBL fold metallo-hydrolase [Rhizobium sp. AAP43]
MKRRQFFKWTGMGLALLGGGLAAGRAMAGNRYYSGPLSDHFDGKVFFNPGGEEPRGFTDLLRWQFEGGRIAWPKSAMAASLPATKPEQRVDGTRLVVTMVGHATLLIQTAGLNILTDPVWSERASPVSFAGPKRATPPGIAFEDLPPIDIVIVTHNHYDHLDVATLKRLGQGHDARIITPLGNDTIIHAEHPFTGTSVMDWGDRLDLGNGLVVHCEPCHHWSARGMGDRRMALWAAFLIETPGGKIYHIGDTGYAGGQHYREIREKHGDIRLAILPIGAYEPRWFMKAQHQNPQEAIEGFHLSGAQFGIGHHFGTFQLTNEGIDDPPKALTTAMAAKGIGTDRFKGLRPGQQFDVRMRIA